MVAGDRLEGIWKSLTLINGNAMQCNAMQFNAMEGISEIGMVIGNEGVDGIVIVYFERICRYLRCYQRGVMGGLRHGDVGLQGHSANGNIVTIGVLA
jgi:hypothetical protein